MRNLITILGPTATGKTAIAAQVAFAVDGEIISADSRQVYRKMDIGTGKDIGDYFVNGISIPYHLINIADPGYEFNLFDFYQGFTKAFNSITNRNKTPILCGGTGLYLDAVLRGYEIIEVPENTRLREELEDATLGELTERLQQLDVLHNTTDISDRNRAIRAIEISEYKLNNPKPVEKLPAFKSKNFGIYFDREVIRTRITDRLNARLNAGLIKEVSDLLESGLMPEQLMFYGLEYRFVTLFVTGEISYGEMFKKLNTAIHQFAKRQTTWFRRMERNGVKINWIKGELSSKEKVSAILNLL
jgi:tRNA dimethylallyltransferase